ncbi:MAG: cold shock domain-containing protein [Bacteroidota bacterium]
MAKSGSTSNKKDREKRKQKERKEKLEKKAERKNTKSKTFDEMIAYVDEFGRISSTPILNKTSVDVESIEISISRKTASEEDEINTGTIFSFDESRGFGFIKDAISKENIFVHSSALSSPVKVGNKVTFDIDKGDRGLFAKNVKLFV